MTRKDEWLDLIVLGAPVSKPFDMPVVEPPVGVWTCINCGKVTDYYEYSCEGCEKAVDGNI